MSGTLESPFEGGGEYQRREQKGLRRNDRGRGETRKYDSMEAKWGEVLKYGNS